MKSLYDGAWSDGVVVCHLGLLPSWTWVFWIHGLLETGVIWFESSKAHHILQQYKYTRRIVKAYLDSPRFFILLPVMGIHDKGYSSVRREPRVVSWNLLYNIYM